MARFEDLPVELLPQILVHLPIPDHLASLCLVGRTFYSFSVPILYKRIAILPWHKSSKSRVCSLFSFGLESRIQKLTGKVVMQVIKLFRTLAACPNLACLVHQLGLPLMRYENILPYISTNRD